MSTLIRDIKEFNDIRSTIRKSFGTVATNYVPFVDIKDIIGKSELFRADVDKCTYVFFKRNFVWNIYYFAPTELDVAPFINGVIQELPNDNVPAIIQVMTRVPECIVNFLGTLTEEMSLQRMVWNTPDINGLPQPKNPSQTCNYQEAESKDILDIQATLFQNFNPIAESIPEISELGEIIGGSGKVLLSKDTSGDIKALIIWSYHPGNTELRYWWVDRSMRGTGIGASIMREMIKDGMGRGRLSLFVDTRNKNAIDKYIHYGFSPDNIFDHIYRIR